ncbi:MAG: hypothetical protein JSU01_22095 [Bacteroidetes bacterium]|nr:hypothetical protein [Bacteroidota bacterium]
MKKGKRHIFYALILLVCFVAGQSAVYVHQHKTLARITRASRGTVVSEKCQLCDAMHHNSMIRHTPVVFAPIQVIDHLYKQAQYDFVSISLVLSSGRAPPAA